MRRCTAIRRRWPIISPGRIAEAGVRDIRVYDVSKTHVSYLISEIWRCRGVLLGSCAYNTQMFPLMENLTRDLLHAGPKDRLLGVFGTYSWNGGGVKNLNASPNR